jgi:thiol-disulfide isomerase/thioredoxin
MGVPGHPRLLDEFAGHYPASVTARLDTLHQGGEVRKIFAIALLAAAMVTAGLAQTSAIVTQVRAAIKANDLPLAIKTITDYRTANGVTAETLEAMSWIARGALAAKDLDMAERFARDTYTLSAAMLKTRPLDQEARLPIAFGASIEVLGQVEAARGARTDALAFLERELRAHKATSIAKRIQKNIHLLSLVGQRAPTLDLSEYLGPQPPTIAALKGKVVLLFFWAHWCNDCKAQAPILAELATKYRDRGLVIFAPTQRFGYVAAGKPAPADEELKYIEQIREKFYPVLAGQPVPVSEANHLRYGVSSTPTLVLVDRGGIIRLYNPGQMSLQQLEPLVSSLVNAS